MLRLEEEDLYAGIATSGSSGGGTQAKGSFNANTQMLTFNNSYLVEKVNSSIASQAQKDAILQELGDDDVVINMNVDRAEGLPVTLNSWLLSDGKETPIGAMLVSKTNPVTIKFLFTGDSGLMFIDWSSFAEYLSLQSGTTITPEQAEEQYGAYVVDENVCTVSGTLGNFEVEFIEDAPVVEKYGATISNFLGDVDANGVLQFPSSTDLSNLVFTGVKGILINGLMYHFANNNSIGSVSFPDLENINQSNSLLSAFYSSNSIVSASFAKLANISGQSSFENAFASCSNITTVNLPELVTVSSVYSMRNMLYSTGITSISFPKLTTVSGSYCMNNLCSGCSNLTTISFPSLTTLSGSDALSHAFYGTKIVQAEFPALSNVTGQQCLAELFSNCTKIQSVSFPALTSTSFGSYTNQFHNMLYFQVKDCTVHFPSNLQSVIGSWSDVIAGFGGTNTTVLFDLPATE